MFYNHKKENFTFQKNQKDLNIKKLKRLLKVIKI